MNSSDRIQRWIRSPRQSRSRETLDRLLEAGARLLGEKGFAAMTIADVAGAAGCSVGSFYERFKDKDALLQALHEQYCTEALERFEDSFDPARWEGVPVDGILHEYVDVQLEGFLERGGLIREFMLQGYSNPTIRARADALLARCDALLAELLSQRSEEIAHPEPRQAAGFIAHVMRSTCVNTLLAWTDVRAGPYPLVPGGLLAELHRVAAAYLGVGDEGTDPSSNRG